MRLDLLGIPTLLVCAFVGCSSNGDPPAAPEADASPTPAPNDGGSPVVDAAPGDAALPPAPPPTCATDWCAIDLPAGVGAVRFRAAWSSSASDVWLGGESGTLLHFDGKTLALVAIGTTEAISAIGGTSATDIWIGTTRTQYEGTLFHGDGKTFAAIPKSEYFFVQASYRAIWAHAKDDVWFGKNTGGLARKKGTSWLDSGPEYDDAGMPDSIWAAGPSDVWVADYYDTRHWNGTSWTKYTGSATCVWGAGPNDVYAAGPGLARFDGNAFQKIDLPVGTTSMAVRGSSATDVWSVGSDSKGGAAIAHGVAGAWSTSTVSATATTLSALTVAGPKDIWAVGNGGTILRYAR